MIREPMLAPSQIPDLSKIAYPMYMSPKLDGVRCVTFGNTGYSRKMKPFRSYQVQDLIAGLPDGLDGELIVGPDNASDVCRLTTSHVMAFDKPAKTLTYHLFNYCHPEAHEWLFEARIAKLYKELGHAVRFGGFLKIVPQKLVNNAEEALQAEYDYLQLGYEGAMLMRPDAPYLTKRATFNSGLFYKLKRFEEVELQIVGFEEALHNTNQAETDERGFTKRSKANLQDAPGLGRVGVFLCAGKGNFEGQVLRVAAGQFTHEELGYIWLNKTRFMGAWLRVRYFGHGIKDTIRHGRAICFRDKMDM
jgi:DNA ligase-1